MRTVVVIRALPEEAEEADGVTFEAAALFPWPEDPTTWLRDFLREAWGEGVRIIAADDTTTDLGWPVTIFDLDVGGEPRVLALYKFLEWAGTVMVRGIRNEASATAVLAGLREGRPDFTGDEAICIADLLPPAETQP